MRKIFLLGIVFLLLSATANAQVRGGLKVGGNLNFPRWEPSLGGEFSSALSFNFGASVEFDLSENFGIELDLLYNSVKTQWDYSGFDPFYGLLVDLDTVFTGQSLSLPILAKIK
ncbi:MAG: outer membrane beta-barrel protein, partial [Asgard group archaeon]